MVLTRSRTRGHTQQTPKLCKKSARKEKNDFSKSTQQDSPFAEIRRNSNEGRNKKVSSQVGKAEEKAAESSESVNSTPAGTVGKKNAVTDAIADFPRVSDLDESAANSNEDVIHFVIDSKPDSAVSVDDDDDSDIEALNSEGDPVHNLLFTIDKVPSNRPFASPNSLLPPDQHHDNDNSETSFSERLSLRTPTKSKSPANQEHEEGTSLDVQSKGRSAVSFEAPCEIDVGLELGDCYINLDAENPTSSKMNVNNILLKSQQDRLIKKSVLTPDFEKQHSIPPYQVARRQLKKQRKKERESTKGSGWFDMKGEEMTNELRNDIKVLRMRSTLDPKRFYKSNDMPATPKFVQIGTVVDNPIDYYHSRVPKKQRKRTLVDELLSDTDARRYNKRKYMELQEKFRHTSKGGRKHKFKKADRQET